MRYVCDAPGGTTWFQIETQAEAALESQAMNHAVEKHFIQVQETAAKSYVAPPGPFFERDIGQGPHPTAHADLSHAAGRRRASVRHGDDPAGRPRREDVQASDCRPREHRPVPEARSCHHGACDALSARARPQPLLPLRRR